MKSKEETAKASVSRAEQLENDTCILIEGILKKEFPDYIVFDPKTFTIAKGSTQVMIAVHTVNNAEVFVDCMANVVYNAELTEDLLKFMLKKNAELHFGKFSLLFDDTIVFSHSLAARDMQESELLEVLKSVADVADKYDDVIVNTNGGERATDLNPSID